MSSRSNSTAGFRASCLYSGYEFSGFYNVRPCDYFHDRLSRCRRAIRKRVTFLKRGFLREKSGGAPVRVRILVQIRVALRQIASRAAVRDAS